jgi:hypothetical protein
MYTRVARNQVAVDVQGGRRRDGDAGATRDGVGHEALQHDGGLADVGREHLVPHPFKGGEEPGEARADVCLSGQDGPVSQLGCRVVG